MSRVLLFDYDTNMPYCESIYQLTSILIISNAQQQIVHRMRQNSQQCFAYLSCHPSK